MTGKTKTISLRLSVDEYQRLKAALGDISLSAFIRASVFDKPLPKVQKRYQIPVADHEALAQVLAKIGQARISQNLNQIAHAANSGLLVLPQECLEELNAACLHVSDMRQLLQTSLGQKALR